MMWTDSTGERQRIIRDLEVMTKHRSPYIVQYFGSDIVQKEVGGARSYGQWGEAFSVYLKCPDNQTC